MPSPKGARYAAWSVLGQKRRTYRVMCTGPPAAAGAAAAAAAGAAAAAAAAAGLAAAAALLSANSAVPAAPPHAPMLADMLEPGSRLLALARGGAARGGAARGALPRRTEAREPRTSGWPTWSSLGAGWREAKVCKGEGESAGAGACAGLVAGGEGAWRRPTASAMVSGAADSSQPAWLGLGLG